MTWLWGVNSNPLSTVR